jgi:hypothetical protein
VAPLSTASATLHTFVVWKFTKIGTLLPRRGESTGVCKKENNTLSFRFDLHVTYVFLFALLINGLKRYFDPPRKQIQERRRKEEEECPRAAA